MLERIKQLATRGTVQFTRHASERMAQRGVLAGDVLRALVTATSASQQQNDSYRCTGGVDLDGDDLTVIVAVEADVVVITVF